MFWKHIKKRKLFLAISLTAIIVGFALLSFSNSKDLSEEIDAGSLEASVFKSIEDPYVAFPVEAYERIQKDYWDTITDESLSELFRLASNKITGGNYSLESKDIEGVRALVEKILDKKDSAEKKEFVGLLVHMVLQNTQPFGRSALYTMAEETKLRETVANINKEKDIYSSLGLEKGATVEEVEIAYSEEKEKLAGDTSPEAKVKLEEIEYAKTVLADQTKKETYDTTGQEPTVLTKTLSKNTLYIKLPILSPQTFNEFLTTSESITDSSLNTLVLDLRGNIGGAVDTLQWFLGPFIGPGQYAYDFFKQGDYTPYKTQYGFIPSLVKYKRVVILIDEHSQSSAEVMASTFTRYNVGVIVGSTTKGWGTIENTFPMETKLDGTSYSLFLVHSITLRPDGQPIEGRGVDPMIYISDADWKNQLNEYFNDRALVDLVAKLFE